jgi:hypothetical protein
MIHESCETDRNSAMPDFRSSSREKRPTISQLLFPQETHTQGSLPLFTKFCVPQWPHLSFRGLVKNPLADELPKRLFAKLLTSFRGVVGSDGPDEGRFSGVSGSPYSVAPRQGWTADRCWRRGRASHLSADWRRTEEVTHLPLLPFASRADGI